MGAGNYALYPAELSKSIHMFGASLNFGISAYTTCVVGKVLFSTLPRAQFSAVQSKLFPIYFSLQSVCSLAIAYIMTTKYKDTGMQTKICYMVSACAILQNALISPQTTKTLAVFSKLRREQGEDSQSPEFKKAKGKFFAWHGASTLVNLTSFVLN